MNFPYSTNSAYAQPAGASPDHSDALKSATPEYDARTDRIRVLLVDDHALVRAGIRALIEMIESVDVVGEAGNGADALSSIERLHPQIVLLDITMPDMNGLEVLQKITSRFDGVRVIILTMHEAREYAVQALHYGAAGFIPKSAAAAELKDAIGMVMQGKTYVSAQTPQQTAVRIAISDQSERELLNRLTPRQREILVRIAEGQSTKEIARALDISVKTVESHRSQLTERLSIHDVAGLVRFAIKAGLINV
jgi:DNA-binding NarL/FixJ family response regulator